MGNLCSSGSEKVDNKQEKLLPEKLKDGEGEALLPKFGAGVGLVTGEGSVDGSARVGSADVTSKVLENGLCVMPGGRSVCPEIVVSSSDVEPVEEDDDDDFLNSVIAVVGDAAGRAITTAQDVVAEIEARNLPQSDDAVVSFAEATPHRDGGVRDSVGEDHAAPGNSSRQSVGAESANWADSVLMSATTAAQSAFDGPSFTASDFTSDFTRKEDSSSMSVLGENANNIVAMSSTVGDKVDELAVTGNSVEIGQVSGENSQPATDSVSGIPTCAEHRVESGPSNSHDVNHGTAGSSGSQINGGDGSSVDIFVAEVEGCENRVALEASDHQHFPDQAWAGRTKTASSGHETAAHVDGLGTSVDARVNFRETSQQEHDLNNEDEENTQSKEFRCDVPSTLGAAVGQPASQVSCPLEKTAGPCADAAGKSTVSAFVKDDMAVDSSKSLENTGGAHFCPPSLSPHTREAEMGILDKGTPLPEDDIFSGWSVVSDTDFLKHANSDDDLSYEAAAKDIVESIITRASSVVSGSEVEKGLEDSALFVDREESIFADQGPDSLLPFLTDRFASPPELSSSETDQCQPAGADSSTSSISQGDLIEREELLIPPVSPLNVLGESRGSLIFGSSSEDIDYASIKQTAWSITDMAVQEAIKIVANGYDLDEHINQAHNNVLDVVYPSVDSSVHDECYSELSETCLNKNTESPTHVNGANCLPEYSTQTGLTSDQQQSARPEITPAEETPAHPTSHTNKPLENDLMDILDNSSHASPVIPSDTELISSSSLPTSNGEHGDSDSNTATSTLYFSKVPSCLPPLDNDSLPGKPVIIINSPDSPADTGSNEDISVHTEALI